MIPTGHRLPPCPVRGHGGHALVHVRWHHQQATRTTAEVVECPRNGWRWFVVDGRHPSKFNRIQSPRTSRWSGRTTTTNLRSETA